MPGKVLVLDTAGLLLGTFPDIRAGHLWAHFRVREPGFGGHVEIFDPVDRTSVIVGPVECRSVLWRRVELAALPCDQRTGAVANLGGPSRRDVAWVCLAFGTSQFR